MELNFNWDEPKSFMLANQAEANDEQEMLPADLLDRAKYAEFLTNFLNGLENKNYTLNLDADWGSGKSYFIKRWHQSINETHPSVYIDAWKSDFSNDPLLTIISAFDEQLKGLWGEDEKHPIYEKIGTFFKGIAPEIAKGLAKKALGFNWESYQESQSTEEKLSDIDKAISDGIGAATKQLIKQHSQQVIALNEFKEILKQQTEQLFEKQESDGYPMHRPIFIFIDELDRCRPNYAIELLEAVKHLFDIPNFVFVIATDTNQLQKAIKVPYGSTFDSFAYLGRFFNRKFTLPLPKILNFIKSLNTVAELENLVVQDNYFPFNKQVIFELDNFLLTLSQIVDAMKLRLREIEQVIDRFSATLANNASLPINVIYLFILLCIEIKYPDIYIEIKNNNGQFTRDLKPNGIETNKVITTVTNYDFPITRNVPITTKLQLSQLINLLFSTHNNRENDYVSRELESLSNKYKNRSQNIAEIDKFKYGILNVERKNKEGIGYFDLVEMASNLS